MAPDVNECAKCSDNFLVNSKCIECFLCLKKFHLVCVAVKDSWNKFVSDNSNIVWICDVCRDQHTQNPSERNMAIENRNTEVVVLQKEIECLKREKELSEKLIGELTYSSGLQKVVISNLEGKVNKASSGQGPNPIFAMESAINPARDRASRGAQEVPALTSYACVAQSKRGFLPMPVHSNNNNNSGKNNSPQTGTENSFSGGPGPSQNTAAELREKSAANVRGALDAKSVKRAIHEAQSITRMRSLQNLQNDDDNKGWQVQNYRKRRRFMVGCNSDDNSAVKGVPKFISLHVTRLDPKTKPEDLRDILINKFPEVVCEEHTSKHPELYASMKITIKQEHFREAWKRDLWPKGALVSRFLTKRRVPNLSQDPQQDAIN